MTLQYGTTLQNDQMNQIQAAVSTSGTFLIYTGTVPAHCSTTASGSLLCTITLPTAFLNSASTGSVTIDNGPWSANASASGTAGYFRILDGSSVVHVQGSIATSGSDLNLNNTSITSGQTVSITAFTVSIASANQ